MLTLLGSPNSTRLQYNRLHNDLTLQHAGQIHIPQRSHISLTRLPNTRYARSFGDYEGSPTLHHDMSLV